MHLMKTAQDTKNTAVPTTAPTIDIISTLFLSIVSTILYDKKTDQNFTFIKKKVDLTMRYNCIFRSGKTLILCVIYW